MEIRGRGSLRQVRPGVWAGRFNIGADPDRPGKYLYTPSRTFHCSTKWEARAEFEKYRTELESNGLPNKSRETLHAYLLYWLSLRKGTHNSPRTGEREELDVRHIMELFPDIKLSKITPTFILETYKTARATGRFNKEVYQIHKRLRQIFDAAVEDGLLSKNCAKRITIPKPEPEPKDYLDRTRLAALNDILFKQPLSGQIVGIHILLRTGIRPGEMYALCWNDIDFDASRIIVRKQYSNDMELRRPKSKASANWIAIDHELCSLLTEWKKLQAAYLKELGMLQLSTTPVASNAKGARFDPTNFGRFFRNFCVDSGFGYFKTITKTFEKDGIIHYRGKDYVGLCPNMFRDIMATVLSGELDVDPETLKRRMRHSEASTTLNYYTHPIEENEYKAAESFAKYLAN